MFTSIRPKYPAAERVAIYRSLRRACFLRTESEDLAPLFQTHRTFHKSQIIEEKMFGIAQAEAMRLGFTPNTLSGVRLNRNFGNKHASRFEPCRSRTRQA
jgi:hypothetical protein